MMSAADVLAVMRALDRAGLRAWIGGGWGIDALVGEQTRRHDDLDLAFRAEEEARLVGVLGALGLRVVEDQRPVRFVMRADDGRAVDLHPVAFDERGNGVQAGFDGACFAYPAEGLGWGRVAGKRVPCLTAAQQVRFHLGYAPAEKDRHDMALLTERSGVALPEAYRAVDGGRRPG
jgi:lincosamide nucleotidyltransferase A/C/D/E